VVHVLAFAEGTHPLRYVSNVGNKIALHVSALGKAELALGSPEEAARQLRLKTMKQIATGTITNLAVLEAQIAQAKEQGWCWVENEGFDGLAAIAVAGYVGDQPLAISVAGPTHRMQANKDAFLQVLREVQSLVFHARDGSTHPRAAGARRGTPARVTGPA
jgi:DNA-binding IclR family transcriptional regulator